MRSRNTSRGAGTFGPLLPMPDTVCDQNVASSYAGWRCMHDGIPGDRVTGQEGSALIGEVETGQRADETVHLAFGASAEQLLRLAHERAQGRPLTPDIVRRVLDIPDEIERPVVHLRIDAPLLSVLRRSREIARRRGDDVITCASLREALVEHIATSAGLDLDRLWFARWWVERTRGSSVARRHYDASGWPSATTPRESR